VPLQSGELKLTQAKFYRVSGGSTQDLGVQPDVAFPGAYDPDRVGESALPDALAFDSVPPVPGLGDPSIAAALPALREQHGARAATDPDFKAFSERLALDREIQDRTSLSLNEARRRQDREDVETRLLEIENERRSSLGLDPLATASELSSQKPEGDPELTEAARIAIDLARFAARPVMAERDPPVRGV
jgi:carboxyl-terminal processing protease